jgi:hypothetical protein
MARARNIKPAFFNNDLLAEIEPLGRIFFIGLWTVADYKGCLEWRPKRLRAQLLPYDSCDVEKIAINLDKSGFIRFYSVQGETYVKIVNFEKHQNPHKNEKSKGSDIPEFQEKHSQAIDFKGERTLSDKIASTPDNNASNPADSLLLIPDSLSLIPESLPPKNDSQSKPDRTLLEIFEYWCLCMNKDPVKSKLTLKRKKAVAARIKEGYLIDDIKTAIYNTSKDSWSMGQNDRNTPFNDLELICRTGEGLEKRRDDLNVPVEIKQFSQKTQSNIDILESFINE